MGNSALVAVDEKVSKILAQLEADNAAKKIKMEISEHIFNMQLATEYADRLIVIRGWGSMSVHSNKETIDRNPPPQDIDTRPRISHSEIQELSSQFAKIKARVAKIEAITNTTDDAVKNKLTSFTHGISHINSSVYKLENAGVNNSILLDTTQWHISHAIYNEAQVRYIINAIQYLPQIKQTINAMIPALFG